MGRLSIGKNVLAIILAGGYVVYSFKGELSDAMISAKLKGDSLIKSLNELPIVSIFDKDDSEKTDIEKAVDETITQIDEEQIEEEQIEIEEEQEEVQEEVIPEETYSSELLDSGYEFLNLDFEDLKSINPDICGWIKIDGTSVDYVVAQSDDDEYYLHHDIYGNKSANGTIYVDSYNKSLDNKSYDLSNQTTLYGHHMKSGKMFASICNYKNQKYADEHPFGVLYTPDGYAYKIDFFSGFVVNGDDSSYLYMDDQIDEQTYNNYVDYLKTNSTFVNDVNVEYGDKIISLVTCSYETNNSRYVLYGVLNKQYTNQYQIEENNSKTKGM